MKRILACILVVMMMLPLFASCNKDDDSGSGTTATTPQTSNTEQNKPENEGNENNENNENNEENEDNSDEEENGGFSEPEWTIESLPESSEGLEFALNEDGKGYTVTRIGTCTDTEIVIGKYKNLPVTQIGEDAFKDCANIMSITIGGGVEKIGNNAFKGCESLTKLNITHIASWCNIELDGDGAFPLNSLKSLSGELYYNETLVNELIIPNGVTNINLAAFVLCTNIKKVTIPDSVTSIGNYAFAYCEGLTSITIPDSVTSIGNFAFYGCTILTSITIPDSVTSIGYYAFYECTGLSSITIPDSVTSIGYYAFEDTAYYNNESNWDNDVLYIGNHLIAAKDTISGAYTIKEGTKTIADRAFSGCTNLTSVTIPDSVTSIGNYAFGDCTGLTSITIPDSVTSIGDGAFYDCTGLTSVTIPDSVTSIGAGAFYACTGLTSVTIGNGVTSIGYYAFSSCTGLTTINFQGTKAEWKAITKGTDWNSNTDSYTVKCTDGDIAKADDN